LTDALVCRPQESFERAKSWVKELQRQGNPNIVIALAGNKTDLSIKRKVQSEDAQAYVDEAGIMFMETSAKTASNVNELFVAIGARCDCHLNGRQPCHKIPAAQLCLTLLCYVLPARALPKDTSPAGGAGLSLTDDAAVPAEKGCPC
jgi:hypothetical protein